MTENEARHPAPWPRARIDDRGAFAAVDLGTNNCRLLVALPSNDGFRVVDSFSRIVRLGEGLDTTGRLGEAGMERAIEALHACAARLSRRPLRAMRAIATQACRQAANGGAFLQRVRAEVGLDIHTISAREEAELAIESCRPLLARNARRALVFDIGGGSTELAWVRLDGPGRAPELIGTASLPIGVITLAERHGNRAFSEPGFRAMVAEVQDRLHAFEDVHRIRHETRLGGVQVLGTSGTVTTLAGVALDLVQYRRPLVDGITLSAADAARSLAILRRLNRDALAQHPCVGPERVDFVLPGCAVFQAIQDTWPAQAVTVADRGLREGMLIRLMRQLGNATAPRPVHAVIA